ncbi:hypothetical protein B0H15DRAFT_933751 [Mycena belliarum]|uniref:Uncharacterized protein n=1 Tax=Mycena belliarum TaxID=1033014 RepID=A0AAD6TYB3_9AGAR|nr:hypothetical protein B0H15DRAFT_933751 [Mycena belliae]
MATTIRIRIQGLPKTFVARSWRIPPQPDHPDGFEFKPIPANISKIKVPRGRSVFINRRGDRRAAALDLEDVKSWGIDEDLDSNLIYANARSSDGTRFCLRLIPHIDGEMDEDCSALQSFARLLKDAMFHSTELNDSKVAGWLVPIHYGMWTMNTGDWGGKVLLSITQGCGVSWNELSFTKLNTLANRLLVARTYEALHDYGYEHGGMRSNHPFRHAIIDIHAPGLTPADRLNGKAPCYIVGFSEARAHHECKRKIPFLPLDTYLPPATVGCLEIANALTQLNFVRNTRKTTLAFEAIEWHDRYCREYPDLKHFKVMMAQRARLYPKFLPVHPTFRMEFADGGLYARVEVTTPDAEPGNETDSDDEADSDEVTDSDAETEVPESELVSHPDSASSKIDSMDAPIPIVQRSGPNDPVSA